MLCTLSDLLSSYLKSKVLQCKALLLSVAPWHQPKPSFCNQTNTQKGRGTKTAMNTRSNWSTISSHHHHPFKPPTGQQLLKVISSHLENVERFELNVSARLLQHVHHKLEVFWLANVASHNDKVASV